MRLSFLNRFAFVFLLAVTVTAGPSASAEVPRCPVDADASVETRKLLNFLYRIQGKQILSGHHNYLGRLSQGTDTIKTETGKTPAVWGSDFGFSDASNDIDNIAYRQKLLEEALKWDEAGAIVTLTWHQANPSMGEPGPFKGNVQSELTDVQWRELLTPGTALNTKWRENMDLLAAFLKVLDDQRIAVLFRPYHEMNGCWFWWGKPDHHREFVQLWRMTYRHLVERHRLHNLVWVWAPSNVVKHGLEEWYPGNEYVDVVAADIYPQNGDMKPAHVFAQSYYERLAKIADGRPMAIGEHGVYPTPEILDKQTGWTWMMGWVDLPQKDSEPGAAKRLYESPRVIDLDRLKEMRD